jgi:hypothetical protein
MPFSKFIRACTRPISLPSSRVGIVMLAWFSWAMLWTGSAQGGERTNNVLRVGYFNDVFVQDAPEGEARTQFEPWVRELNRKPLYGRTEADRPLAYEEFRKRLVQSNDPPWDIFPMYAYDFVELKQRCNLDAILVPDWSKSPLVEYSIYVAANSRITKISDLQNRNILFEISGRGELPFAWFDNQIRKQCNNSPWSKVCNVRQVSSAMQAALPVYFQEENMEACLLSKSGFEQVNAGNPAVGAYLKELASAPKLLSHVIACRKDLPAEHRQHVINVSLAFSERNSKLTNGLHFSRYKPEYLENIEHEWLEYLTNDLNETQPRLPQKELTPQPKNLIEARAAASSTPDTNRNSSSTSSRRDSGSYRYPTPNGLSR